MDQAPVLDGQPDAKIVDVYVCKIRAKLDAVAPDMGARIQMTWGRGYMLKACHLAPARRSTPPAARKSERSPARQMNVRKKEVA